YEAKHHRCRNRAGGRRKQRAGRPGEGQIHDPDDDESGGCRAGRDAEYRRGQAQRERFERVGREQPHAGRSNGLGDHRAAGALPSTSTATIKVSTLAPRIASARFETIWPTASRASRTRRVVTVGKASATALSSATSSSVVLPPG